MAAHNLYQSTTADAGHWYHSATDGRLRDRMHAPIAPPKGRKRVKMQGQRKDNTQGTQDATEERGWVVLRFPCETLNRTLYWANTRGNLWVWDWIDPGGSCAGTFSPLLELPSPWGPWSPL